MGRLLTTINQCNNLKHPPPPPQSFMIVLANSAKTFTNNLCFTQMQERAIVQLC